MNFKLNVIKMDKLFFKWSRNKKSVYGRIRDGKHYTEVVTLKNGEYPSEEDIINRRYGIRIPLIDGDIFDLDKKVTFYIYNDYKKEYVDPIKQRFNDLIESQGLYEAVQFLISEPDYESVCASVYEIE